MKDVLRRIFQSKNPEQECSADEYFVYSFDHDEVVTAKNLLAKMPRDAFSPTANSAWEAHAAFQRQFSAELAWLTSQALRDGQELIDSSTESDRHRTCVSILIDHSGSMRGLNLHLAALVVQYTSDLLEIAGIPTEIAGFTTVDWHGNPVRKKWVAAGRPPCPGRLCALRHIVYTAFEDQTRTPLVAMFHPDILRENIDGEAIEWVAARLRQRDADRRALFVISDGVPADDSTLNENHPGLLWEHLKRVSSSMENGKSPVETHGVGIRYDVSSIYDRAASVRGLKGVEGEAVPFIRSALRSLLTRNPQDEQGKR